VAKDLRARIAAHNAGAGAKYTRQRLPVKLVYSESAVDRGAAQRRELEIKSLSREAKRALCRQLMTEKRRPSGRIITFKK
jgi:putative endonuclease